MGEKRGLSLLERFYFVQNHDPARGAQSKDW